MHYFRNAEVNVCPRSQVPPTDVAELTMRFSRADANRFGGAKTRDFDADPEAGSGPRVNAKERSGPVDLIPVRLVGRARPRGIDARPLTVRSRRGCRASMEVPFAKGQSAPGPTLRHPEGCCEEAHRSQPTPRRRPTPTLLLAVPEGSGSAAVRPHRRGLGHPSIPQRLRAPTQTRHCKLQS